MNYTGKSYDVTAAIAAMVLFPRGASDADLRGALVAGSDIPEDKIDFAFSELSEGLEGVRGLVELHKLLLGRPMTVPEVQEMISGATWIDDDKGQATYTTKMVDENGDETAKVTVETTVKRK